MNPRMKVNLNLTSFFKVSSRFLTLDQQNREWYQDHKSDIDERILLDTVYRSSIVTLISAIGYFTFIFTSLPYLRIAYPSLTLWDNFWPRMLISVLPALLLFVYLVRSQNPTKTKMIIWLVSTFAILHATCWIYVWPSMIGGNAGIFLFVHASNIYILFIVYVITSPPPKYALSYALLMLGTIVTPIAYILNTTKSPVILQTFLNDSVVGLLVSAFVGYMLYLLRLKLSIYDSKSKYYTKSFVGHIVSEAIFTDNTALLESKKSKAILMVLDIRDFSEFITQNDTSLVARVMDEYNATVPEVLTRYNGYLHKAIGDSYFISFGAMDGDLDLSDIPLSDSDFQTAEENIFKHHMRKAKAAAEELMSKLIQIRDRNNVPSNIRLCGGIAYGESTFKLKGHASHRMEYDLDGQLIILAKRLEEYTKHLCETIDTTGSFLIYCEDAAKLAPQSENLLLHQTNKIPVRNFPKINNVFYKHYEWTDVSRKEARFDDCQVQGSVN